MEPETNATAQQESVVYNLLNDLAWRTKSLIEDAEALLHEEQEPIRCEMAKHTPSLDGITQGLEGVVSHAKFAAELIEQNGRLV